MISPIAFAAVQKFDAVFAAERSINGLQPAERVAARRKDIAPLVSELIEWIRQERTQLSPHNDVVKAMNYMLKRTDAFTRFLEDCSDRGGERAAIMFTLIQTAKPVG